MTVTTLSTPVSVPRPRTGPEPRRPRAARVRPYVTRMLRERAAEQDSVLARVLAGLRQQPAPATGARPCRWCGGLGVQGAVS